MVGLPATFIVVASIVGVVFVADVVGIAFASDFVRRENPKHDVVVGCMVDAESTFVYTYTYNIRVVLNAGLNRL